MGYTSGGSPKGGPLFNDTPQTVADLNAGRAYTELVGNRRIGTTNQRDTLPSKEKWEGLEFRDTDMQRTFTYQGGQWVPNGATVELVATPLINNAISPNVISGWTVDAPKSVGGDTVLKSIVGAEITLTPGTFIVSAMVTLNNAGVPQAVNGRSFIEVLSNETTLQPRLRANAVPGEDSWAVSGIRSYTAATSMVVKVLAAMAPTLAGSHVRLIISRVG